MAEFWGFVVKGGETKSVTIPEDHVLTVSNAALVAKAGQEAKLYAGVDRKYVLASFASGRTEQVSLDVTFFADHPLSFGVEGQGEIHLVGSVQFAGSPDEDDFDSDEDEADALEARRAFRDIEADEDDEDDEDDEGDQEDGDEDEEEENEKPQAKPQQKALPAPPPKSVQVKPAAGGPAKPASGTAAPAKPTGTPAAAATTGSANGETPKLSKKQKKALKKQPGGSTPAAASAAVAKSAPTTPAASGAKPAQSGASTPAAPGAKPVQQNAKNGPTPGKPEDKKRPATADATSNKKLKGDGKNQQAFDQHNKNKHQS